MMRFLAIVMLTLVLTGCVAPSGRLTFPREVALTGSDEATPALTGRAYDVNRNGRIDYRIAPSETGRLDRLEYDDDEDGVPDRVYRLDNYPPETVPHLIILFDSIPFEQVAARYESASWTWFDPPCKVIAPYPTMSPVIFSRMLGAPPQVGAINQYYDRARARRVSRIFERTTGDANPWERRLHYRLKYWQNGMAFLDPRPWFNAELAAAKEAFDSSPDRVTIVYFASTACMLSKFGEQGLSECLDGLDQLCMQVLYERRGAVKISATADHGHTLSAGTRIDLDTIVRDAGFRPADSLKGADDVVIEQDGLVNYAGFHTSRPADVAAALTAVHAIELAMYVRGERVIIRTDQGEAAIERRGDLYRYVPIDADVLAYEPVIAGMRTLGTADSDGWATADAWFTATVDHNWPDAPVRAWGAFHGIVVNTPDVMIATRRGFYCGLPSMDWFIDMASTHGGFDQVDSATFLLTMTGRAKGPMRTEQMIPTIEPSYDPSRLRR